MRGISTPTLVSLSSDTMELMYGLQGISIICQIRFRILSAKVLPAHILLMYSQSIAVESESNCTMRRFAIPFF